MTFGHGRPQCDTERCSSPRLEGEPDVDICRGGSSRERDGTGRTVENRRRVGNCVKRGKINNFPGCTTTGGPPSAGCLRKFAVGKMADGENMLERDAGRSDLHIPPPFPCRWAFGAPRG